MRNLLPERNRRMVRHEYYMRLGVVALLLLVGTLIVGTASLLPAHFASQEKLNAIEMQAAFVEQSLAQRDEVASTGVVRMVNIELAALVAQQKRVRTETLLRTALAGKPAGISISSFRFKEGTEGGEIEIEGQAEDRDALLAFRRALEGEPNVLSVKLPISNLAQTNDINFSLTIELKDTS